LYYSLEGDLMDDEVITGELPFVYDAGTQDVGTRPGSG
jgi:hypothetical protein